MEENQIMWNVGPQQPVNTNGAVQPTAQPVQPTEQSAQQPVQQAPVDEAAVSMQIQELLVKQQQYQQRYNELVAYLQQTQNLPIEQVNQIKLELDQLNALFIQWKQKLQALWYNPVQVNKPTEVKKWSKYNFSLKKLAVWCLIVLVIILAWFFITLKSLIKNPYALSWIGISVANAKMFLQLFAWLIFGSIVLLMIWVIISNVYRLITVKNQAKWKTVLWLLWWLFWAAIVGISMGLVFWEIGKIQEPTRIYESAVQPFLVGFVWNIDGDSESTETSIPYKWDDGKDYKLIAPAEFVFGIRLDLIKSKISDSLVGVEFDCGNGQVLAEKDADKIKQWWNLLLDGSCVYWKKGEYTYKLSIHTVNSKWENSVTEYSTWELDFQSEIQIYLYDNLSSDSKASRIYPENGEFVLWQAPKKIRVETSGVFHDLRIENTDVVWDWDGGREGSWGVEGDRVNQEVFDYTYKTPKVYHPVIKLPGLEDVYYTFPVRVNQSDVPICEISVENFPGTTKYKIFTDFLDSSSVSTISSYNYTIKNSSTKTVIDTIKDSTQEVNYQFPEKWNYIVMLDYVTIDGKQWQCESDIITLEKETFDVQYSLLSKDFTSNKYSELCNSKSVEYDGCSSISLSTLPQSFELQLRSITPSSNSLKKVVYFEDKTLLNEDDTYSFDISEEWTYTLKIVVSDVSRWMDEESRIITFTVKKADIVWHLTITDPESRATVSDWFEPLTVVLDASKTEINIPDDEIVYFTWDFWDGEIKQNQQNWVVAHTYNYDYVKETWIFTPKVTIKTLQWHEEVISGPKLNVKKWLIDIELSSPSHPSRQAQIGKSVTFSASFDGLPESMTWDFWDWSSATTCQGRTCTDIKHTFKDAWLYSVKLTLEFDAIQKVDSTMDFKAFE